MAPQHAVRVDFDAVTRSGRRNVYEIDYQRLQPLAEGAATWQDGTHGPAA